MRHRQLAALVVVALWAFSITTPLALAQYTQGLPPGIINVEVDGQPLDSVTVPVTNRATPEISGRVDLGVAAIELAVADGDVIRFAAELDDRGQFRASIPQELSNGQYTLYIGDVLIGAFVIEGAVPTEREPGKLLDIARVAPYPADFGDGLPGVGFLDGRFFTIEEEALRSAAGGGGASSGELRQIQRNLAEAGWLQRYENRLVTPNPDDPASFAIQFSSFVVEYASGADARTAFVALTGDETGDDFATIGNESMLMLLSGTTPDTGTGYQAARLVYRLGPLLGVIVYADLRNQQPDLALLESVAQKVASRGVAIADRQTLPLGSMTLRLDASTSTGSLARRDFYEVRGGQLTAIFGQDAAQEAGQATLIRGTTDVFSSTSSGTFTNRSGAREDNRANRAEAAQADAQTSNDTPIPSSVVSIEGEPPPAQSSATPPVAAPVEITGTPGPEIAQTAQVFIKSTLYEFPGDEEADAWFVVQRDQLASDGQSGNATYRAISDAPPLGDASALFASERASGEGEAVVRGYRIYARQGPIMAVIEVGSIPDLTQRAAVGLMERQLECITAQACAGPASLPDNLFGERTDSADGNAE